MLGQEVTFCVFSTYVNEETIKTSISKYQVKLLIR